MCVRFWVQGRVWGLGLGVISTETKARSVRASPRQRMRVKKPNIDDFDRASAGCFRSVFQTCRASRRDTRYGHGVSRDARGRKKRGVLIIIAMLDCKDNNLSFSCQKKNSTVTNSTGRKNT